MFARFSRVQIGKIIPNNDIKRIFAENALVGFSSPRRAFKRDVSTSKRG
jgi:hypothetical protein